MLILYSYKDSHNGVFLALCLKKKNRPRPLCVLSPLFEQRQRKIISLPLCSPLIWQRTASCAKEFILVNRNVLTLNCILTCDHVVKLRTYWIMTKPLVNRAENVIAGIFLTFSQAPPPLQNRYVFAEAISHLCKENCSNNDGL